MTRRANRRNGWLRVGRRHLRRRVQSADDERHRVTGNSALGGAGGNGYAGGAGGYGQGGGVYIYYGDSATITNATISGNTAVAAAGGQGTIPGVAGDAQGGGVFEYAATVSISGGAILGNSAVGGKGGGYAQGGGIYNSGYGADATLTGVWIGLNSAVGGQGTARAPEAMGRAVASLPTNTRRSTSAVARSPATVQWAEPAGAMGKVAAFTRRELQASPMC